MTPFQVLAQVPDHIPPTLPVSISEASMTTVPLPPSQMPLLELHKHLIQKCGEIAALKERLRVHRKNDCIWRSQDPRLSQGITEETGEGSSMTMPVLALQDAPHGSPKRRIPAGKLVALRKQMEVYHEEERHRELQEEQELRDSLANTKCDTEMTSEGSTWTAQDSTEAAAPPVTATAPPPQASDNGQRSGPTNRNLTELEIALANPNLHPEDKKFTESAKFKNTKKMVPRNTMTAR